MNEAPVVAVVARATTLRGHLDGCTRDRIKGWALGITLDDPAELQILDNGRPVATVLANGHRPDLVTHGIGNGWHGFELEIPGGLSPLVRHVIQVRRTTDGSELIGSPAVIEAAGSFSPDLQAAVAGAVKGADGKAEIERALAFLAEQTDAMLQRLADADAEPRLRAQRTRRREPGGAPLAVPARRALMIDERLPARGRDGGSQVILSHAEALKSLGYQVSFIAADTLAGHGQDGVETAPFTVYGKPFHHSVEDILRRQVDGFDLVYLHRASVASRYLALVRVYQPRARLLYCVADLHHLRLERQAVVEGRPELLTESRALRLAECTAAWSADAVLTHSAEEAAWLRRAVPEANVHRVPWSVEPSGGLIDFSARRGLAFVGHFRHAPNMDAAYWLAEAIMPLVWRGDLSLPCFLVGDAMPDSLGKLEDSRLHAMGRVDDLDDILGRMRLTVAPLRYGAGVKAKVVQSLAAGVPCVMSPVAAEGIGLPPDLAELTGRDEAELASLILRMHGDPDRLAELAGAGMAFVRSEFNPEKVRQTLLAAIEGRQPSA